MNSQGCHSSPDSTLAGISSAYLRTAAGRAAQQMRAKLISLKRRKALLSSNHIASSYEKCSRPQVGDHGRREAGRTGRPKRPAPRHTRETAAPRRRSVAPTTPNPRIISAQLSGSGTAGVARRSVSTLNSTLKKPTSSRYRPSRA